MENGEDNQEEKKEQSPFVPDLGLPSDETVNHGQQGEGGAMPKSAGGAAGGGEAPLSFRRFLEPAGPVGLGRPDVAAGLPDFVQDHLATAAAATARDTRDWQPLAAATGTRRKVPPSVSTSAGGAAATLPAGQPQGLPDFLSDGPMGTLHGDAPSLGALHGDSETNGARHRAARPLAESSHHRLQRLERENACLRRDVERLQQQLQYERRRTSSLQEQLYQTGSGGGGAAGGAGAALPADGGRLQEEVRSLRAQNVELRRRAGAGPSAHQAASQIVAAATGAEQLISQLMSGVRSLRTIAARMEAGAAPNDGDPDLGQPPGGSPC